MFIRSSSQTDKKTQTVYTTYRLVESYRNQDGKVRQHTLLNLGCHFDVPTTQWKRLADRVEEILRGQASLLDLDKPIEKEAQRIAKVITKKTAQVTSQDKEKKSNLTPPSNDYQTVDINTLDHHDVRKIGAEHAGHHAACQLELEPLLLSVGFNKKQTHIALATIIGRLISPGSDLSTHRYLVEDSALDDLLEDDFSQLSLKQFYGIADKLYQHKDAIEKALYQKEKDLFTLQETVTLYDITNTYFEGRCLANDKAQYGYSKEKRSDCPLVSLGLILDASGFPKKSKILPGNVSEPKTLQDLLSALDAKNTATIVMDAGIATEENITWLKTSGYEYIVVSRKQNLIMPESIEPVTVKQAANNQVQAVLVKNEQTHECELYCHSQAKEEKSKQMLTKAEQRYEAELKK